MLPEFKLVHDIKPSGPFDLLVICPRKDCGATHAVVARHWLAGQYGTRPCPYCFKTARIPARDVTVKTNIVKVKKRRA